MLEYMSIASLSLSHTKPLPSSPIGAAIKEEVQCVTPVRSGQNLVAARAPRSFKNGGKHTKTSVPPTIKALHSQWSLPEPLMFGEGL